MARKQTTVAAEKVGEVQDFVLAQLEEARGRLERLEKELISRGRTQQKEIEALISRVRSGKELKALEKRANAAGAEVKKALDGLQDRMLSVLGVASHREIELLSKDLHRLSKKVDSLLARKTGTPSA